MSNPFNEEQRNYLQGFMSGLKAAGQMTGVAGASPTALTGLGPGSTSGSNLAVLPGPDAIHLAAQDRFLAAGKKLVAEETAKREAHPFDIYDRMKSEARSARFPKGVDVFRWKFHGLFYVAPAQDSFMCRLRIPNGILSWVQLAGIADLAERYGGGYSHVTTRANIQFRDISAENGINVLEGLYDLGLTARGSGADNIRNITGSPTAGIDADELIDTRPLARDLHFHILNKRELYGLPRKFNVAFDGGGRIAVLEETNDIGFQAVRVGEGAEVTPGIYFRVALGGITGHGDIARDCGVVIAPEDCLAVADAIIHIFAEHGDRTSRLKARLKYVLDSWGIEKYWAAVEERLGRALPRVPVSACASRAPLAKNAHIGVHPQGQVGLSYIGVTVPVGRLSCDQMRALADIARDCGSGTIRLTVWQNLIISDVPDGKIEDAKRRIEAAGLDWRASPIRAGLVACTGNTGCKFAASDTKRHALAIADHVEGRLALDTPINVHLTGCHHSCAQHYIGDIGLIACKVEEGEEEVEGYHILVGGGYGAQAKIGRELYRDVKAGDAPMVVEGILRTYMTHRDSANEDFAAFVARHDGDALTRLLSIDGLEASGEAA
jgi:ferredoxin-nitrite reductase